MDVNPCLGFDPILSPGPENDGEYMCMASLCWCLFLIIQTKQQRGQKVKKG